MRISLVLTFLLAFGLLLNACTTDSDSIAPDTLNTNLFGRMWLNSYEAKQDETPIYRPQGYSWAEPPMRYAVPFEGGDGFRFEKDGTLTYQAPGIGPGPTLHEAVWWQDDLTKPIFRVHLTDNYRPDFQLEIVSVEADLLRARYLQ